TIITAISIFIGSIISVSKIEKKGILNGALVGLIYILSIYLISSIISGSFAIDINSIILIIVAILAGMIGGIIGVNIKH
ncbi:MAG: TIGR04086 family membrane protein, partial [Clostridia bacterium]